jgi:hypothetical protein
MTYPAAIQQHLDAMRVAQSRIHKGDCRFYVQTANGHVVAGPYSERAWAEEKLDEMRAGVLEELAEDPA